MSANSLSVRRLFAFILSGLTLIPGMTNAQTFPSGIVRYVVPDTPGSGGDVMGRIIANAMTESFSQQMIVDNRAGACSNLGAEFVARAPADGYTMLVVSTTLSANASLYKNLGYDLGRDFAPVTQLALTPHVLIVHPSLPVKTVAELGVPGSDFSNSPGLMVPAKTLPENIAILHRTAVTALKKPEVAKRINELGAIVVASAPAEYGAFVKKEMVNFG